MRFINVILAGVFLIAPGATQAMVTEADHDQKHKQGQVQDQSLRGRKLPGNGGGNGNGNGGNGNGNGNGNGDPPPGNDNEPKVPELSGKVIISRKSIAKLRKEGKGTAEIDEIRSRGKNEINQNRVVFESDGGDEGDFQVVEVGHGRETAFINSIKNNPSKAELYEYVEPDYIQHLTVSTNDPIISNQYHHTNMQDYQAWDIVTGSSNVTIGICDTGLQLNHPDLAGNVLEGYHAPSQTWQNAGGPVEAVHPHGTMCAGCAAAIGNNGVGLAGVGWNFKHRPGRVTDATSGGASSAALADCARKMCEKPDVKVVSVSYSGVEGAARRQAATYCKTQGALMVNAAGNDNRDLTQYGNADDDDLIVAGATDSNDNKVGFSAYGSFVDVWAPGSGVWTTNTGSTYSAVSGTSFSCPLVAGLIALIWSHAPDLTPNEVESILKQSTDIGNLGNHGTVWGRINSFKAVQAAGSGTPFPTSAPTTPPPTNSPTTPPPTTSPTTPPPTTSPTTPPPTTSPTTPPPTPAPIALEPTITATFDGTCPRCTSVGGACTSGALLLNSRGNMGTAEPNGPNTIDSCTDGSAGSFHGDESNDAIEVSALGGGFLQVGRLAVVKATVWAWSSGSSDTADFYVSDTVINPNWVLIGSVQPSGGGANDLESPPFELTSTLQAVRVNFRYSGSQSSCSGGSYDDADDLVFAVAPIGSVPPPTTADPTPVPTPNPTTADPTPVPTPNPTTADPTPLPTPNPTTADPTPTPCTELTIEILTDEHPDQTSWTVANECTGETVAIGPIVLTPNTHYSNTFCLLPAMYQFLIVDSIGNGFSGSGYYLVTSGDSVIDAGSQFGSSASTNLDFGGC